MTDSLQDVVLTRPAPAAEGGPLDEPFYDLVESRFRREAVRERYSGDRK